MNAQNSRWKRQKSLKKAVRFALALLLTAFFLAPVYWIFITALKSPEEIFAVPAVWFPEQLHFENFTSMFSAGELKPIFNSLLVATFSTLLALAVGTLAAYSLARYRTGGRALAVWIISLRMLPPIALAFPLFLFFAMLGWVDTYHGLILLYAAINLPYVIWVMRGFVEDVPLELEESAAIDGASRWQILWYVVFPLVRMGMLATGVFAFIYAMNEFAFAVVLTRVDVLTFTVKISHYFGNQTTSWAWIAGLAVLGSLPVFIAVLVMQRYLVRGMSMGAIKG
ncbi:MAG: carbohydrate ABC transporter permease [Gammaproteobacteria bacterium]